jgi:ATP-binding cassette subfamily C protein CydCD
VSRSRSGRLTPLDPRLLRAAPALRRHVAVLVPLAAVRAAATVAAAVLLAQALTSVWHGDPPAALLPLAGVLVGRALVDGLVELLGGSARERARAQLRSAALAGLAAAGPLEVGRRDAARVSHAVGPGLDALDGYVTRVLPAVVQSVVVPPLVLLWVARTDLVSLVLLLVTLPVVPLFLVVLGLATRDRTERSYATLARLAATLLDLLQGLPTLKVHGRAQGQVAAVARVAERHRIETVRALRWAFLSGFALDLIATLSVALVALTAGCGCRTARWRWPRAGRPALAPEVFVPLRAVGAQYHASTDALEAAAVAVELAALPRCPVRGTLLAGEPVASLVDVTVRHPGRDEDALAG